MVGKATWPSLFSRWSPRQQSVPFKINELIPSTKKSFFATLTSAFGSELFHGPKISNPGIRLLELPKDESKASSFRKTKIMYRKYPVEIAQTKPSYVLRNSKESGHFKRFYHMTMRDHEVCILGSTSAKQIDDARINEVRKKIIKIKKKSFFRYLMKKKQIFYLLRKYFSDQLFHLPFPQNRNWRPGLAAMQFSCLLKDAANVLSSIPSTRTWNSASLPVASTSRIRFFASQIQCAST